MMEVIRDRYNYIEDGLVQDDDEAEDIECDYHLDDFPPSGPCCCTILWLELGWLHQIYDQQSKQNN